MCKRVQSGVTEFVIHFVRILDVTEGIGAEVGDLGAAAVLAGVVKAVGELRDVAFMAGGAGRSGIRARGDGCAHYRCTECNIA